MSGFGNNALNNLIKADTLIYVVERVIKCIEMMCSHCEGNSIRLNNNEPVILSHLFYNYLNNDDIMNSVGLDDYRFETEVPENFTNDIPIGRVDLKVYGIDDFRHRKRYYIIECKRVDGTLPLNRAYIDEGMRRFIGEYPKYSSYFQTNSMFGFVLQKCNPDSIVGSINELLENDYKDISVEQYLQPLSTSDMYMSAHTSAEKKLTLIHAFYDISRIVSL